MALVKVKFKIISDVAQSEIFSIYLDDESFEYRQFFDNLRRWILANNRYECKYYVKIINEERFGIANIYFYDTYAGFWRGCD